MDNERVEAVALEPCPFCGARASVDFINNDLPYWRARCSRDTCGAEIEERSEAEAVAAWNTRTPLASLKAENERMSAEFDEILTWRDKAELKAKELQKVLDGAYPEIRKALGAHASFAHAANSKLLGIIGPLLQIKWAVERAALTKQGG